MRTIRTLLSILALTLCISASAQLSYETAKIRADRFFGYQEWASASALYNYMLHQRPDSPDTYGRAIVTTSILNDSTQSMHLLKQAMAYNIPLDSVLTYVQKYSFIVGRGDLYEHFMLQAAAESPWLARPLDNQLLKYYTFRNNGAKMIQYAQTMLNGAPDDTRFLMTLAKGYMLQGQTQKALELWHKVTVIAPNNYQALLNLANYYQSVGNAGDARAYFGRAYQLHPTPYVEAQLR